MIQLFSNYADRDENIIYIHHLATDINYKGVGKQILKSIKKIAIDMNKKIIRVDNISTNQKLNEYYEKNGFIQVGIIDPDKYDGKNAGILREFKIN